MKIAQETTIFHYLFSAMGVVLLGLIGWIGVNVAHIPVIDQEISDLKSMITNIVDKQLTDHEQRLRSLEKR